MTRSRLVFLNLFIAAFVTASLYDIVRDEEHWPFSPYPMFSGVWRAPGFKWLRLFGVTADGREFPLDDNQYVAPFDQSRLPKALRKMMAEPDGDMRVEAAVRDCFARYETLRVQSRHGGPPLAAMRLYEIEWTIDRDAANVDRPDRKTFIAEVRQ